MKNKFIGCSFQFSCDYRKHFLLLFNNIDIKNYLWYVCDSEIYCEKSLTPLFEDGYYSGLDFAKIIAEKSYHIIHSRVFAISNKKDIHSPDKIKTYEEFCNSDCDFAILCADCYCDFYAKDEKIIQAIVDSCKLQLICKVSYITEDNDTRTSFYI